MDNPPIDVHNNPINVDRTYLSGETGNPHKRKIPQNAKTILLFIHKNPTKINGFFHKITELSKNYPQNGHSLILCLISSIVFLTLGSALTISPIFLTA